MSEERKPIQKSPLSHILGVTSDVKKRAFSEKHADRPDPKRLRDSEQSERSDVAMEAFANASRHDTGEVAVEEAAPADSAQGETETDAEGTVEPVPEEEKEAGNGAVEAAAQETSSAAVEPALPTPAPRPRITVDSSSAIEAVAGLRQYISGVEVYHPGKLLFEDAHNRLNSKVLVRISRKHISRTNPGVEHRKVWGTEVYTDDSDVVAALYHSGNLPESRETASDDLVVAVHILPKLQKYQGCFMHGLNSRSWGSHHDGVSFRILSVSEIPEGTAEYPVGEALDRMRSWGAAFVDQRLPREPTLV